MTISYNSPQFKHSPNTERQRPPLIARSIIFVVTAVANLALARVLPPSALPAGGLEPNLGQAQPGALFIARAANYSAAIVSDGLFLRLTDRSDPKGALRAQTIGFRFNGANPTARAEGLSRMSATSHYLNGATPTARAVNVPQFERVRVHDVYAGIDVDYYRQGGMLEYDFIVSPRADPSAIEFTVAGTGKLALNARGDLIMPTALGELVKRRPYAYQVTPSGSRTEVGAQYALLYFDRVAISVDAYDRSRPLIIDPVLAYASVLGGGNDYALAVAVDSTGNAYVTGYTSSSNFPLIAAYDSSLGGQDAFVTKINPAGSAIVYSTFLGGRKGGDAGVAIAVDGTGNVTVAGRTNDADFPVTTGAYQLGAAGGGSFVTKLNAAGSALVYSTYVLGAAVNALTLDATGAAIIAGKASSTFVTTAGAFQPNYLSANGGNAFVAKLTANGTAMTYATFLGGSGLDSANAVALDSTGNVFVAGSTTSLNFPVSNAFIATNQGGTDGFISKLNSSATSLIFSTYYGGAGTDTINALTLDSAANVYVAGETYSANLPVRHAVQATKPGIRMTGSVQGSGFVAKLDSTGSALDYASFFGGEVCLTACTSLFSSTYSADAVYGIAVDRVGRVTLTGRVATLGFPMRDSISPALASSNLSGAFIARISRQGDALLFSSIVGGGTNYGGSDPYLGRSLGSLGSARADAVDGVYAVGNNVGTSSYVTTTGAFQVSGGTATVLKIAAPNNTVTLSLSAASVLEGQPVTLSAAVTNAANGGVVRFYSGSTALTGAIQVVNGVASQTLSTIPPGVHRVTAFYDTGQWVDSAIMVLVVNPAPCN